MSELDTQTQTATPTETPTPAPATQGTPAPQSATPTVPAASPDPTQPPATGGQPDNTNWVPSYRIRETREAAIREAQSQFAHKEAEYQARMAQIQSQLHALVGVQPPQHPELDAVKSQFAKLYPGLAKLEDKYGDIEGIIAKAGELENQNNHYWTNYGRQAMDRLFSTAQTSIGSALSDDAKRTLHSSFVGFVQSSPEMTARYQNDPTIVDDFWKAFSSGFIDPVRRSTAAGTMGRVPGNIPQDTPGGAPHSTPPVKPANLDERMDLAWAQYSQDKIK